MALQYRLNRSIDDDAENILVVDKQEEVICVGIKDDIVFEDNFSEWKFSYVIRFRLHIQEFQI